MDLQTKAILIASTNDEAKDAAFEESVNRLFVVRSCATCYFSKWNADKTEMTCERVKIVPPLWAVAMGCKDFDYLPF